MDHLTATHASSLESNPFWVLGVSTRDDRQSIIERAEDLALHIDPVACDEARSTLISPRTRLAAELAWLPGLAPQVAVDLVKAIDRDPIGASLQRGLPELARTNLMASALHRIHDGLDSSTVADFMRTFGDAVDQLAPEKILGAVNEDRAVAGFPQVRDVKQIRDELEAHRKHYNAALKAALDAMPSTKLIDTITLLIGRATQSGSKGAPQIIDDLIDSYAAETVGILERERQTLETLTESAKAAAKRGASAVAPVLDKIEKVVRNWYRIAQPIQLSMVARGITHQESHSLAFQLRSLGIDLCNDFNLIDQADRMTTLLRELFSDVGDLAHRLDEDAEALRNLKTKAKRSEQDDLEWRRAITYKTEVGLVLRDELSISPDGISWKGQAYSLESIAKARWGAIRRSVNGIPTGTEYTIAFGTTRNISVVSLRKEATYARFVDCLWRAVGVRLLFDMGSQLKEGKMLSFGSIAITDTAVHLTRHKFLGSNQTVRLGWDDVRISSANGSLLLSSTNDKNVYGNASFMDDWNVHMLDALVRGAFKKGFSTRLTEFFDA